MGKCQDLVIFRKSTKTYELHFVSKSTGTAEDITDWTVYMTVKENYEDADGSAVINKTVTSHSDPTNGKTLIELDNNDTDLSGIYHYSIDYKDDEDNEGVLFWGKIKFAESVRNTRS